MEQIRQAVERAKGSASATEKSAEIAGAASQPQYITSAPTAGSPPIWGKEVALNSAHLESKRIIAHDIQDPRSKSFDMLRTQVLQSMELKSWQFLGITSPTAGCGKTFISVNLALSISRLQNRSVLLVDMDLQKPMVANYLGLKCDRGLLSVLEGRTSLRNAIIKASFKNQNLAVLPCESSTLSSSEWMASEEMNTLLKTIRREFKDW